MLGDEEAEKWRDQFNLNDFKDKPEPQEYEYGTYLIYLSEHKKWVIAQYDDTREAVKAKIENTIEYLEIKEQSRTLTDIEEGQLILARNLRDFVRNPKEA